MDFATNSEMEGGGVVTGEHPRKDTRDYKLSST